MDRLKNGTIVEITSYEGAYGEIVTTAFESVITGNFYIIKLLLREGRAWKDYPSDYVVLPDSIIKNVFRPKLDILRDLHVLEPKNSDSENSIEVNEQKLRDAVEILNLDTPHVRAFLEKAGKEYLKYFGKKGTIKNVYPAQFMVELQSSSPGWKTRMIRIPIKDFFAGKSSIADIDFKTHMAVKFIEHTVLEVPSHVDSEPIAGEFSPKNSLLENIKFKKLNPKVLKNDLVKKMSSPKKSIAKK